MRKITIEIGGKEFYITAKHIEQARIKANSEISKGKKDDFYNTSELWAFHLLKDKVSIEEFEEWTYTLDNSEYSNLTTFHSRSQTELGKLIAHYIDPQSKVAE